jgi:hypothetical protein
MDNLGSSDRAFTESTTYPGFYSISVPEGFTPSSNNAFDIGYGSTFHKTSATCAADTWTDASEGSSSGNDGSVATGHTYYGITLYVSGSTWKVYFSTNPDIPVLTPDNFINSLTSTPQTPIIGERTVGNVTSGYNEHYRLTFPGTQIGWNKAALPDTYTFGYSTTINGKTFSSTNFTENNFTLYGVYGQTDPVTLTFTITPTSGTAITVDKTVTLNYFGHNASDIINYVHVSDATPSLFFNGYLVAKIVASDNATAGYKASFYEPLRTAVGVTPTAMKDFTTAINPYTYHDIVTVAEMKAKKAFLLTPSFTDLYQKNVTSVASDFTVYYVSKPHYNMVKLPFTQAEMNAMVTSVNATTNIGTLQDGSASAPALNLEKVGSARIKAISGSHLYGTDYVEDVPVTAITSSGNTNDHSVSFTTTLVPTGIEGVTVANVSIIGGEGMITVNGANNVAIYDTTGRLITKVAGQNQIDMPAGLYIVRADSKVAKVVVK